MRGAIKAGSGLVIDPLLRRFCIIWTLRYDHEQHLRSVGQSGIDMANLLQGEQREWRQDKRAALRRASELREIANATVWDTHNGVIIA